MKPDALARASRGRKLGSVRYALRVAIEHPKETLWNDQSYAEAAGDIAIDNDMPDLAALCVVDPKAAFTVVDLLLAQDT